MGFSAPLVGHNQTPEQPCQASKKRSGSWAELNAQQISLRPRRRPPPATAHTLWARSDTLGSRSIAGNGSRTCSIIFSSRPWQTSLSCWTQDLLHLRERVVGGVHAKALEMGLWYIDWRKKEVGETTMLFLWHKLITCDKRIFALLL